MAKGLRYKTVMFTRVNGADVPCQPWPQMFYVSRERLESDSVEVRPLTVTGLVKGIGRNFIAMNYWRLMFVLACCGFIATREGCILSWRDWRWKFWQHAQLGRLKRLRNSGGL